MSSLLTTFWKDFQELKSLSQFLTEVVPTPTVPRCSSSAADHRGRWRMGRFTGNRMWKKQCPDLYLMALMMQENDEQCNVKVFSWLICSVGSGPWKVVASIVIFFTIYFKFPWSKKVKSINPTTAQGWEDEQTWQFCCCHMCWLWACIWALEQFESGVVGEEEQYCLSPVRGSWVQTERISAPNFGFRKCLISSENLKNSD